jgi:hypothetical protein
MYLFNRTGSNKKTRILRWIPLSFEFTLPTKKYSAFAIMACCFHIHDDKVVSLTCALFIQPQADSEVN